MEKDQAKETRQMIYDICVGSYPFSISRIDAMDNRTQIVMAVSSTLVVAYAVMVSRIEGAHCCNVLLYLLGGTYSLGIGLGLVSLYMGKTLKALQPKTLRDNYLEYEPEKFQDAIINDASDAMISNFAEVSRKQKLTLTITALLLLQIIFMASWLISIPPATS